MAKKSPRIGLRIGFMGTPDFAATALQALLDAGHDVVCAYSQPPRPKGRGHKLQKSPVHELAESRGIPVHTPKSLKSAEEQDIFKAHNLDVAVVAAYGLLLPLAILDAPKLGCLNIHASLLPRWRGASPIQRAIWAGDPQSGVTIMQMDEGLDTGDMLAKVSVDLDSAMTTPRLHDILAEKGAALCLDVLERMAKEGRLPGEKQDESGVTYAHLLKKEDGRIDWSQSAAKIDRQIRALNPWPGIFIGNDQNRIKITKAVLSSESAKEAAGTLISRTGDVVCGDGKILILKHIQPAGKQAMDVTSAINGGYLKVGEKL